MHLGTCPGGSTFILLNLFSGTCPGGRRRRTTCHCSLEPPGDEKEEEVLVSVSITSGWAVGSQTK